MIRRNASLILAIAIFALGAAQASAELIGVDPAAYSSGTLLYTVSAPPSSTLPNIQLFVNAQDEASPSFVGAPNVMVCDVGGVPCFVGVTSTGNGIAESWQGGWGIGNPGNDAGYQLVARFRGDDLAFLTVPYVEVDFRANSDSDWGWLRAWNDNGTPYDFADDTLLAETILDLTAGSGTAGTATLQAGGTHFSYVTATAYGSGVNVLITGIRYGDGPEEPVVVPEPASMISLLLGSLGLVWVRRRQA